MVQEFTSIFHDTVLESNGTTVMDKFNNSSNINLTPIPKTSPNISKSKINKRSI